MHGSGMNARYFLIIDDDPIIGSLLEQMLMQRGAKKVYLASDGAMALGILTDTSKPVDVLSLDLNMPNMDGVTFLSRAADLGFAGGLFLVSGETTDIIQSATQLARLLGLDCRGSFSKPIDFETVVEHMMNDGTNNNTVAELPNISVSDVEDGLSNNRLQAYYQPKISTKTGQILGAEALARIVRDDGSTLHVGEMIRVAEEEGLIRELTWQMAKRVIWEYDSIKEVIPNDFNVSFNISTDLLTNTKFCEQFTNYVRQSGAKPANIVLEITESKIPADVSVALEGLTRLRLMGFGLAIDDFGTGYSNMESLRIFPFTELKIDQQFVVNARHDPFAWACVEASVKLAKQLKLRTVAEGIETEFESTLARAHEIDEQQGYLFAKPMPRAEFIEFASQRYSPELEIVSMGKRAI